MRGPSMWDSDESVCPRSGRRRYVATVGGRYRLGVGVIRGVRLPNARSLPGTGGLGGSNGGFGRWDTEGWLGRWKGDVEADGGDVGY